MLLQKITGSLYPYLEKVNFKPNFSPRRESGWGFGIHGSYYNLAMIHIYALQKDCFSLTTSYPKTIRKSASIATAMTMTTPITIIDPRSILFHRSLRATSLPEDITRYPPRMRGMPQAARISRSKASNRRTIKLSTGSSSQRIEDWTLALSQKLIFERAPFRESAGGTDLKSVSFFVSAMSEILC